MDLDELTSEYERVFPGKDLHGELIDDMGMEKYKELLSRAMAENKFIYIKSAMETLDGGTTVLLSSDSEIKSLNQGNINRNKKDEKPKETIVGFSIIPNNIS